MFLIYLRKHKIFKKNISQKQGYVEGVRLPQALWPPVCVFWPHVLHFVFFNFKYLNRLFSKASSSSVLPKIFISIQFSTDQECRKYRRTELDAMEGEK